MTQTIYQAFEATAGQHAQRTAVVYLGTRYSYHEIKTLAERFSAALTALGIVAGQRVKPVADTTVTIAAVDVTRAALLDMGDQLTMGHPQPVLWNLVRQVLVTDHAHLWIFGAHVCDQARVSRLFVHGLPITAVAG